MSNPTPAPISQRAFAKILGVSAPAVGKAIKAGRLKASLIQDADGVWKIADVDLARREWSSATDYSKAPSSVKEQAAARERTQPSAPRGPVRAAPAPTAAGELDEPENLNLTHENAREKHWRANKAEIEYLERIGQLVEAGEMEALISDAFTRVRSRLAGLPTRVRQQIPHLTAEEVAIVESFVREALDELVLKLEDDEDEEADGAGAEPGSEA